MDKNYCDKCGTENEIKYKYCKNCGTPLNTNTADNTTYTEQTQYVHTNSQYNTETPKNAFFIDSIDGIPHEEVRVFIGSKSTEIMPKFSKMILTRSKISWCWPAALLGFFLGPLGASLWFFYRKMYKNAGILAIIGAVVTLITGLLNINPAAVAFGEEFLEQILNGDINSALASISNFSAPETVLNIIGSLISDTVNTATCILCGLFGYHLYKKHCVAKIYEYRSLQTDPRYYRLGLAATGGVSGGMLALGIVIILASESITSVITSIISLLLV